MKKVMKSMKVKGKKSPAKGQSPEKGPKKRPAANPGGNGEPMSLEEKMEQFNKKRMGVSRHFWTSSLLGRENVCGASSKGLEKPWGTRTWRRSGTRTAKAMEVTPRRKPCSRCSCRMRAISKRMITL